jgi:Family of unknown function (DUF5678)
MSQVTVENILTQITQLPSNERVRLRTLMAQEIENRKPAKTSLDKRVPPIPAPNSQAAMKWLAEHAREYVEQWVALDGERLIAHGKDSQAVYAAAKADGAYLPLVEFIEDPDNPTQFLWS